MRTNENEREGKESGCRNGAVRDSSGTAVQLQVDSSYYSSVSSLN